MMHLSYLSRINVGKVAVLSVFLIIFAVYLYIAFAIFPHGPTDFDEYGYLHQAMLFSQGKISQIAVNYHSALLEPHMIYRDGKIFSKYPFGFSAVLTLFIWLGSYKIGNPFITTIGWVFTYKVIRHFLDKKSALVIVLLAALSPYSLGYAASLHSQALAMCLATGALWAFIAYQKTAQRYYYWVMALFCAFGVLARPIDFLCVTTLICLGFLILYARREALNHIAILLVSFALGALVLVAYNSWQMGELHLLLYDDYVARRPSLQRSLRLGWTALAAALAKLYAQNAIIVFPTLLMKFFVPLIGSLNCMLFIIGLLVACIQRQFFVWAAYCLMLVGVYNFNDNNGWSTFGARYWFGGLGAFIVICALGWFGIVQFFQRFSVHRF